MELIEQVLIYHNSGLSMIPVNADKQPIGSWKKSQTEQISPNGQFNSCYGIGIVCGKGSGNLEVIDIDCKYDLTGNLFNDYKELINATDPTLLRKMVVEKSTNNGYHFFYRCEEIEGNKKLAQRLTVEGEREITYTKRLKEEQEKNNPKAIEEAVKSRDNDKIRDLIETRGQGGYVMCYPSPKYDLIYGKLESIQTITPQERKVLIDCAKTFNEYFQPFIPKKEYVKTLGDKTSPFDDYNERADVIGLLQNNGWKVVLEKNDKVMFLRPGGTGKWSADFRYKDRVFYVFTSSTEFDIDTGYNPSQVLATLQFNGDFSATYKWLLENGYGKKTDFKKKPVFKTDVSIEDDNFDFVASKEETDSYIEQIRNGIFKQGLSTGFPDLDNHWRFKPANLDIIVGHDNTGKSLLIWYFGVLSAKLHNWNWIIYSSENKMGGVKAKLLEFSVGKKIKDLTEQELNDAKNWVEDHFTIIRNKQLFNYLDMLAMGRKLLSKKKYDAFLVDPYNSLDPDDSQNKHDFDYRAMSEFRLFIEQTQCSIYLNCHAVTEALRRKYPKGHQYEGYPMPPDKSDTEGGGKFSNKADNFLTIHRLVQHPDDWMITEIHVKKIKEMETGGKHTFLDSPVKLKMTKGSVGFENMSGFNPLANGKINAPPIESPIPYEQRKMPPNPKSRTSFEINPNLQFEPSKEFQDDPF